MRVPMFGLLLFVWFTAGATGGELTDDFSSGTLDLSILCPCQIDTDHEPVTFDPTKPDDFAAAITVREGSLGGRVCKRSRCAATTSAAMEGLLSMPKGLLPNATIEEPVGTEDLGTSFFSPTVRGDIFELEISPPTRALRLGDPDRASICNGYGNNPYCDKARLAEAALGEEPGYAVKDKVCMQRQEVRTKSKDIQRYGETGRYAIRMAMPSGVGDTRCSLRWVLAQWKHEPVSSSYGKGFSPSPFFAFRYDDTVLHVTIQSGKTRCMIASAPHPGLQFNFADGMPTECQCEAGYGPQSCKPDVTLDYGEKGLLTNIAGRFSNFEIELKPDFGGGGKVVLWQDGKRIVTATGRIGYAVDDDQKSRVKFKFGQYRDYQDNTPSLLVDSVSIPVR